MMDGNEFWTCPNCNTVNNGPACRVCGYTPGSVAPYPQPRKNNNRKLIAVIIIAAAAAVIAIVALLAFVLYQENARQQEAEEVIVPVAEETVVEEDVFYVNRFDDSGIYVREAPSKSSGDILYIKKGDRSVVLRYMGETVSGTDGYNWFMVETPGGDVGYVREDVVVEQETQP